MLIKEGALMVLTRRSFLKKAAVNSTALLTATSFAMSRPPKKKPNIVFFYVDDLGWRDVGFMGSKYYDTPAIDKLASEGMIFTDAYAMPTCLPSRACLMSGQYPPRHGVYAVDYFANTPKRMRKLKAIRSRHGLSPDVVTIAEVLKQQGYATGHFGKWHLGNGPETWPKNQGFDINFAGCGAGRPDSYFRPYRNIKNVGQGPKGEYLPERLTDEACDFLDKNKNKPIFLMMSYYNVHVPLHAKQELIEKYDKRQPDGQQNISKYGAMVTAVDLSIKAVLDKLKVLGIEDNTVVFFTSDNGGQNMCTSNSPLRGQKGTLTEGGIRVPMFVKWPGVIKPGTKSKTPVTVVDFFPTLMEIASCLNSHKLALDGESIIPLLKQNGDLKRKSIFWHLPSYNGNGSANARIWQTPAGVIRKGDWKLFENFEDGSLELYNLKDDISESNNLVSINPKKANELLKELKTWQKETNAPIPKELNPKFEPDSRDWLKDKNKRL